MANNELLAVGTSLQSYVKIKTPKYSFALEGYQPTGCSKSKVPKVRHCCTHGYAFIWSFIGANYSQTWSILCRSTSV